MGLSCGIRLAELVSLQRRCHGRARLLGCVGDGFLYLRNPFVRRVRDAALAAGFRYSLADPEGYFGFPLIHLDTILRTRRIPYRPSFSALVHLERSRPGFFTLADLTQNRPAPNYLLHESAHAVAFDALFGRPRDVKRALSEPAALVKVMLGESFAMTAEYFAACAVNGALHAWFFSISSYRRRTQKKKTIGELIEELGFEPVCRAVLLAVLYNNFLVDSLDATRFRRLLVAAGLADLRPVESKKLRSALNGVMVMSPEFRYDTARLFLTMFGRSRNIRRELSADPLELLGRDPKAQAAIDVLVAVLSSAGKTRESSPKRLRAIRAASHGSPPARHRRRPSRAAPPDADRSDHRPHAARRDSPREGRRAPPRRGARGSVRSP
jgi:hypothetical protein